MKIALIGNSEWQNRRKIQETLHGIKNRFGEEAVVIGAGGNEGANFMIRKYYILIFFYLNRMNYKLEKRFLY